MRPGAVFALGLPLLTTAASGVGPVVAVPPAENVLLSPGGSVEVRLSVVVSEGFHLQANPASEKYLVPTKVELAQDSGVKPGKPVYPPGHPHRLQGASSDLSIYEGRFEIRIPLRASPEAQPGERTLIGKLHYQACDARRCFVPTSLPVELRVTVAPPKAKEGS